MRAELNKPSVKPFDSVADLGVVISESWPGQRHVGVLYKTDGNSAMVCDLAWHKIVRNEPPDPKKDLWLQSSLDEISRRVVAPAIAGTVALKRPPISYSPIYDGVYFEGGSLEYKRDAPGDGLTCATFILAIFEALGFDILIRDTWSTRATDQDWQDEIVRNLEDWAKRKGVDVTDHVAAIRSRPSGVRYRPEEVAAGMADQAAPLSFDLAEQIGKEIVAAMAAEGAAA